MRKPLAIDLFCGLGGWTDGLLAEGYDVIGFDIERHVYGEHRYPAQLVIQDVLTLHGSQFKTTALIVASPPCQEYSYMAMPWKRAKALAADYRSGKRDVKQLTGPVRCLLSHSARGERGGRMVCDDRENPAAFVPAHSSDLQACRPSGGRMKPHSLRCVLSFGLNPRRRLPGEPPRLPVRPRRRLFCNERN